MLQQFDPKFAQETVQSFQEGEIIFAEGEDSHEMYIVQDGEVVISKKAGNKEIELAVLKRGDFFGEMSLLESLPRSATAKARGSSTRLLTILPGGFLLKIRRDPTFAFEMLQALSRRIRVTNERLISALHDGSNVKEALDSIVNKGDFIAPKAEVA